MVASLKSSDIIHRGTNSVATATVQDDKLYIHTRFFDDAALERNKQIRGAGLLDKGKLGLHEDEDIRLTVSCPSLEQWKRFQRLNPETYDLLMSKNEPLRMKGARQLQLLHPEWVVQSRL